MPSDKGPYIGQKEESERNKVTKEHQGWTWLRRLSSPVPAGLEQQNND